tara:strand:- start:68396 stop:68602 length:207 start_codon:yes stop_codon:yes gene_type:complete
MANRKYRIEELTSEAGGELGKATIGRHSHGECVVVYGSDEDLTERVMAVINGLNNPDRYVDTDAQPPK